MGKRPENDRNVEEIASKEIYQTARAEADVELAKMKENMKGLHDFAVTSGRAQAFKVMQLLAEFMEMKQVAQIVDRKEYLNLPGVTSIEDYFERMGIKPRTGYNNLKIARTLDADELQLLAAVGFTRRDLLGYASLPDEARMEIRDGKIINLENADREEIRDIIEQILLENKQVKEETETEIRTKDKEIESKRDLIRKQEKELTRLEKQARQKNLTPEEDAIMGKIEELSVMLDGYSLSVENVFDTLRENPFPNAVAAFITLADNIKMRVSHFRESAVTELAPVGMLPEEEWVPPPMRVPGNTD